MDMPVVSESLHRSELLSEETVTLRVIQAGSADRKLPEVQEGQVQEEERGCYETPASNDAHLANVFHRMIEGFHAFEADTAYAP
jgi:hypothetical protein